MLAIIILSYLMISATQSAINLGTHQFKCDATPMHCVGDDMICDARDGDCSVQCEQNALNPTGNTCSTYDAGCCDGTIYCPDNLKCIISCGFNCNRLRVYANSSTYLEINGCDDGKCNDMTIFCPQRLGSTCNIIQASSSNMQNLNIYAFNGFSSVYIFNGQTSSSNIHCYYPSNNQCEIDVADDQKLYCKNAGSIQCISPQPSMSPTNKPTKSTKSPTNMPTAYQPTNKPTKSPTNMPVMPITYQPTNSPTISTQNPSNPLTKSPTNIPSISPTKAPTNIPSISPIKAPSKYPTLSPSYTPSKSPTLFPSNNPTVVPTTTRPTQIPTTSVPTKSPSTFKPSIMMPTNDPTNEPTFPTPNPTKTPSINPTQSPTNNPTISPTLSPTVTNNPTINPSETPTANPITFNPTTTNPTFHPTSHPTINPTVFPSLSPSISPTTTTESPDPTTANPTEAPTMEPTVTMSPTMPTVSPSTFKPSIEIFALATTAPSISPSAVAQIVVNTNDASAVEIQDEDSEIVMIVIVTAAIITDILACICCFVLVKRCCRKFKKYKANIRRGTLTTISSNLGLEDETTDGETTGTKTSYSHDSHATNEEEGTKNTENVAMFSERMYNDDDDVVNFNDDDDVSLRGQQRQKNITVEMIDIDRVFSQSYNSDEEVPQNDVIMTPNNIILPIDPYKTRLIDIINES